MITSGTLQIAFLFIGFSFHDRSCKCHSEGCIVLTVLSVVRRRWNVRRFELIVFVALVRFFPPRGLSISASGIRTTCPPSKHVYTSDRYSLKSLMVGLCDNVCACTHRELNVCESGPRSTNINTASAPSHSSWCGSAVVSPSGVGFPSRTGFLIIFMLMSDQSISDPMYTSSVDGW